MFRSKRFGKGRAALAVLLMVGLMATSVSCGSSEGSSGESTTGTGTAPVIPDPQTIREKQLEVFTEEHNVDEAAIT